MYSKNSILSNAFFLTAFFVLSLVFTSCDKEPKKKPPEVKTDVVTDISYNSAIVHCEVISDKGSDVYERGACWSSTNPNPAYHNFRDSDPQDGEGSYSINMKGLKGNTTYNVRAYARNLDGISYGENIAFTTTSAPPSSFGCTINGSTFAPTTLYASTAMGGIDIVAIKGTTQFTLSFPETPVVGTHDLASFNSYTMLLAYYGTIYYDYQGDITVTEFNSVTGKLKGTFQFTASDINFQNPLTISNGTFEVYR